ncbi:hypothetical protein JCM11491_001563 [Sporobolomyces phaffii]
MAALLQKESLGPTLLPTPSPSPPLVSQPQIATRLPNTTGRRTYTEAERQAHIFLARQCAKQLRVLHLASGAQPVLRGSDFGQSRYHLDVERLEGDRTVTKRVSVIIPRQEKERFKSFPALTLVPPPRLGHSPSKRPSLFPHTKVSSPSRSRTTPARRLSLPSLRSLSLLPAAAVSPPAPFRSRAAEPQTPHPSPSKHHPTPVPALSRPHIPAAVINLDTSSRLLQRRKAALALKFERRSADAFPSPPRSSTTRSVDAVGTRKRGRSSGSEAEADEGESNRTKCARWSRQVVAASRTESALLGDGRLEALALGERRGKKVRSLTLS